MRNLMAAAALALMAFPSAAPAQGAGALSGVWLGYYGYAGAPEEVEFQAKFSGADGRFAGTTIEINTFGDRTAWFLTAIVAGTVSGNQVHFVKTYDGTGGQTHQVQYDGAFTQGGRCIEGSWRIGTTTGPFEICADARLIS